MTEKDLSQQRLTLEDALRSQMELLRFVRHQIDTEPHYLQSEDERQQFFQLLSFALLSQGSTSMAPRTPIKNSKGMIIRVILLGNDIHHFALKLMDVTTSHSKITTPSGPYPFETKALWKVLYGYLVELFSKSQAEALARSKERELFEKGTVDYKFDSKDRIREY